MQDGERVRRSLRARPQHRRDVGLLARGEAADEDTLGDERVVELVVHDPPVAHHHEAGALARFGRHRAASGRRLRAGLAQLVARRRTEAIEIELVDPAVAPDLVGVGGPGDPVELLGRSKTTLDEPVGPAERTCGVRRERSHGAVSQPLLPC